MGWTEEQQRVIDERGGNLLVSAAAGSGKTAVLVERIISLITDKEAPVSLDRVIIMTFTRAAAGEMRERIGDALNKRIKAEPDNAYLKLQKALLPRARISTIDSICQNLVRQYYQYLDIDPGFRVGDEGELKLLRREILSDLIEDRLSEEDHEFFDLMGFFNERKAEAELSDCAERLFRLAQSDPWPEDFLENIISELDAEADGDFENTAWYKYLRGKISRDIGHYHKLLDKALDIAGEPGGPESYIEGINIVQEILENLPVEGSYKDFYTALYDVQIPRLYAGKKSQYDPELKEKASAIVKACREYLKKYLPDKIFRYSPEKVKTAVGQSTRMLRTLTEFTMEFSRRFAERKRELNIVDFNDMEHMALNLLYRKTEDGYVPSETADRLASETDIIMIDEYQDSNPAQEALANALSAERLGRADVFMVGDIKQSIYRFRMAQPGIFIGKYKSYGCDSLHKLIELNKNFRSRKEVLDSVNEIFASIMTGELGDVVYDSNARLYYGASYNDEPGHRTELLVTSKRAMEQPEAEDTEDFEDSEDSEGSEAALAETGSQASAAVDVSKASSAASEGSGAASGAADASKAVSSKTTGKQPSGSDENDEDEDGDGAGAVNPEYEMIADRICRLISPADESERLWITDKETGLRRKPRYRDIAILMRSLKNRTEPLIETLRNHGIPAYCENTTGYFDAMEVETVLSFLSIIDNPHQDIPLAAVMRSAVFDFTDDELLRKPQLSKRR